MNQSIKEVAISEAFKDILYGGKVKNDKNPKKTPQPGTWLVVQKNL